MLQVDLLLRPANLTSLVTTWHGTLSQVKSNSEQIHLISPPENLQYSCQKALFDQDPSTTQLASNSLEVKHIYGGGVYL